MIELLVGPICSGKSTYAILRASQGAIIINDDSIVTALHGDYELYSKGLKPIYKTLENTILQMAITMGRDVVVDRPNMSRDNRKRFIGISLAMDEQVVAVMFPNHGPEKHARMRFECNPRGKSLEHWIKAAQRHQGIYQKPELSEGLADIVPVADVVRSFESKGV